MAPSRHTAAEHAAAAVSNARMFTGAILQHHQLSGQNTESMKPDIAQERTLDQMNMEILEWHNDDALIVAQLLEGKVTYGRIVPNAE